MIGNSLKARMRCAEKSEEPTGSISRVWVFLHSGPYGEAFCLLERDYRTVQGKGAPLTWCLGWVIFLPCPLPSPSSSPSPPPSSSPSPPASPSLGSAQTEKMSWKNDYDKLSGIFFLPPFLKVNQKKSGHCWIWPACSVIWPDESWFSRWGFLKTFFPAYIVVCIFKWASGPQYKHSSINRPVCLQLYSRPNRLLSGVPLYKGEGQTQDKSAVTSLLDGLNQAFEEVSSQVEL